MIPTHEGVVLKRGTTEIAISGAGAAGAVDELVRRVGQGSTREELCARFEAEDRPAIGALIDSLLESRLFRTGSETNPPARDERNIDVWYWQFQKTHAEMQLAMAATTTVLVGDNAITRRIQQTLLTADSPAPWLVDDPALNALGLAESEAALSGTPARRMTREAWLADAHAQKQCVVAASEFGNLSALLEWNRFCIERGHYFLPVLLQNSLGYIGPLVVPGESACLDCVRTRWNAGFDQANHTRQALEEVPPEGQRFIGFHPAMPALLAELSALELTKFLGPGLPSRKAGVQIEMQMLGPRMTTRNILKVPRCPSCSPLRSRVSGSARR